jgi:hypothetical protein
MTIAEVERVWSMLHLTIDKKCNQSMSRPKDNSSYWNVGSVHDALAELNMT